MTTKHFVAVILIVIVGAAVYYARPRVLVSLPSSTIAATETKAVPAAPEGTKAPAVTSVTPLTLSAADQRQLNTVKEILASKNDNDPRLDSELRDLSPELKQEMRQQYKILPMEDRNGRGLYAFLLGRDVESAAELDFFGEVLAEPPCLSLQNCGQPTVESKDPHDTTGLSTTLLYPQLVSLLTLERQMGGAWAGTARSMLEKAAQSSHPVIAQRARQILDRSQGS